jgi:hypothetical protein
VGVRLPAGFVQPVFLTYAPDDLHIMAVMDGHPDYEAVEAMIRKRMDGGYAIRAIVTRHDQSQVDHINDDEVAREMAGADRAMVRRAITLTLSSVGARPRAVLAFESFAGEAVQLDITAAGPPVAAGAGLTDPGDHSRDVSLPLMWRGASALAGPQTHVTVDGRRYGTPFRFARGPFVAHEGYFTERHLMGAVRAGVVEQTLIAAPALAAAGADWIFERDGRRVVWRAADAGDGRLRIDSDGESVIARPAGASLILERVRLGGDDGLSLDFGDATFAFAMAGQNDLVTGRLGASPGSISLEPTDPAWAVARAVHVTCRRDGNRLTATTTIGLGSEPARR